MLQFGSKQIQKHSATEWLYIVFQKCAAKGGHSFCVYDMCEEAAEKNQNHFELGFSSHNPAPMWTKWMMGNQTMNTGS